MQETVDAAQDEYFEFIYVLRDDNQRRIQLSVGNHPTGLNEDGSYQSEGGAALVFSQEEKFGLVVALIYLYETSPNSVKPIVWGVFDSPADAAATDWFNRVILDFSRCCRASSLVDTTVIRSDRRRMQWLVLRSKILQMRGKFRVTTKVISSKPSWIRRVVRIGAALIGVLSFASVIATLSGVTVPGLWAMFQQSPPSNATPPPIASQQLAPVAVSASALSPNQEQPPPSTLPAVASVDMPVISGRYTFCPSADDQGNPKLLDFLYDVRTHASKVAFFDVQIGIDCVLNSELDYRAPFSRTEAPGGVNYFMQIPLLPNNNPGKAQQWISGERSLSVLRTLASDNGSMIAIHNGNDSRNLLSRFQPHVEGSTDILFGPYSIKESYDDDAITVNLDAPFLDSASHKRAAEIAKELSTAQVLQAIPSQSPKGTEGGQSL